MQVHVVSLIIRMFAELYHFATPSNTILKGPYGLFFVKEQQFFKEEVTFFLSGTRIELSLEE